MSQPATPNKTSHPRSWRPHYGLGGLLLVMLVCSVTAAAGYYLLQALRGDRGFQAAFILFTLVAPLFLVIVLSAVWTLVFRRKR